MSLTGMDEKSFIPSEKMNWIWRKKQQAVEIKGKIDISFEDAKKTLKKFLRRIGL